MTGRLTLIAHFANNQGLTPISHPEQRLRPDGGDRADEQAQQAPQLAAPVHLHQHYRGGHYTRPSGGSAAAVLTLSLTTFSA